MLVYLANLCCQKVLCALCPGVMGWKCFAHGPLTTAAVLDCRSRLKQKCFMTAAHLHNLMPVARKNKTPYEVFHGSAPDVSYLRKWGCLAYVKQPKHQTSKLGAQSGPGMFVGYCPHTKGYRVRLRDRVVVTPHVHFVEEESGAATLSLPVETVPKGVGVRPIRGEPVRDVMMYRDEVMESESSDLEEDHHSPRSLCKKDTNTRQECGRGRGSRHKATR
jgi:hypothetical protein